MEDMFEHSPLKQVTRAIDIAPVKDPSLWYGNPLQSHTIGSMHALIGLFVV